MTTAKLPRDAARAARRDKARSAERRRQAADLQASLRDYALKRHGLDLSAPPEIGLRLPG